MRLLDPDRRDPARRPGPGARVLCRPGVVVHVLYPLGIAVGVAIVVGGATASVAGTVVLGLIVALGVGALYLGIVRLRVLLDGSRLHTRAFGAWSRVVDLDRLTRVQVVPVGQSFSRRTRWRVYLLRLLDEDGGVALVPGGSLDLRPLHREITVRVPAGDPRIVGDLTAPMLDRSR